MPKPDISLTNASRRSDSGTHPPLPWAEASIGNAAITLQDIAEEIRWIRNGKQHDVWQELEFYYSR